MKILLVHGVGYQERPDNQPWERPWEEAITAGIQYFDPAFAGDLLRNQIHEERTLLCQ
jgi:hypothetical protein